MDALARFQSIFQSQLKKKESRCFDLSKNTSYNVIPEHDY